MPNTSSITDRLALCSWSLRPTSATDLIDKVTQTGLKAIQIALDPIRSDRQNWETIAEATAKADLRLISGMLVTIGEDYSTFESIRRTGGIVPDETWDQNWINIQENATIAKELGLDLVTFHAGFLPEDRNDPKRPILLDRLRKIADYYGEHGLSLGFETGQETASTLEEFLIDLDCSNVGVNFDPANMLINGMGDPIEALEHLIPRIVQVHIKDGSRPKSAGNKGREELLGTGEVDWQAFLQTLNHHNYAGPLVIERERGESRIPDIRHAIEVITQTAKSI